MEENPRLILHFDINKTVICSDPVSGVDMDMMINSILTECCWGYIDEPTEPFDYDSWILVSTEPSTTPPNSEKYVCLSFFLFFSF